MKRRSFSRADHQILFAFYRETAYLSTYCTIYKHMGEAISKRNTNGMIFFEVEHPTPVADLGESG
jgi:hypothetical protein